MAHKLLLADDSVTIQRVIELTFADEDVEVTTVGDGQLAIERLDADPPDIILADIDMPKRDGYEVAAYVKSRPKLAHIPVVLLTGAFEPIDQARAAAAGSSDVLAKPFEPQMVINRVKELLGKKRQEEVPQYIAPEPPAPPQAAQPQAQEPLTPQPQAAGPAAPVSRQPQAESSQVVSLDDYFDQLDAAFSNLQPAGAQAAATAGDVDWPMDSSPESQDAMSIRALAVDEKKVAPPPVVAAPSPVASGPRPVPPPTPSAPPAATTSPAFVPQVSAPTAVKSVPMPPAGPFAGAAAPPIAATPPAPALRVSPITPAAAPPPPLAATSAFAPTSSIASALAHGATADETADKPIAPIAPNSFGARVVPPSPVPSAPVMAPGGAGDAGHRATGCSYCC